MQRLYDMLTALVPQKGDVITADFLQMLTDVACRQNCPPDSFVDATGVYPRRRRSALPFNLFFGHLDGDLAYGSSANCSVYQEAADGTLEDSGEDLVVYPPPYLQSGYKFASGSDFLGFTWRVRSYLIGGPCPVSV